ncbi:MAG TPA: 5-formyltetrahydrofolate cyclo-ligase [Pseudonocardiaceae bacterium]|nr:5-formyltetrahydrofolate cyclo-ligase [Pseudonocardiaceae bacterium]
MTESAQDPEPKAALRRRLSAARRELPAEIRAAEASALVKWVGELSGAVVCCYLPVGTEPGNVAMVDAIGARVLLPIVTGAAPLDWAEYTGETSLVPGPYGLREPGGPRLGPDAIALADVILIPALAVDRHGVRLGRGAGHYDRSLPKARADAALIAIVRDDELFDRLPAEPHDVRMTATLTPGQGIRKLDLPD